MEWQIDNGKVCGELVSSKTHTLSLSKPQDNQQTLSPLLERLENELDLRKEKKEDLR